MTSSSDEIIRRAKEMDLQARYGTNSGIKTDQMEILTKYIQILENKINILTEKVDRILDNGSKTINQTHEKLLNMMWDWRSSSQLAELVGYRQEHVSRLISDMKKNGMVEERREGKKRLYKRVE